MRGLGSLFVLLLLFILANGFGANLRDVFATSSMAHARVLFGEDFEGWDPGLGHLDPTYYVRLGWNHTWLSASGTQENGANIVDKSLERGNLSLRLAGNVDGMDLLKHNVSMRSSPKTLILEFVFRIEGFSSDSSLTILGITRYDYADLQNLEEVSSRPLDLTDTALVLAHRGFVMVKDTPICAYSVCTWYTIRVIYDTSSSLHKQSIFLDEKLVQERSLITPISSDDLCFFVFSHNQSVLLDSISVFEPLQVATLVLSPNDGGNTIPFAQIWTYDKGSNVTVWAQPNEGYSFDHWAYDSTYVVGNPLNITLNENLTLTPFFSKIQPFYYQVWFWSLFLTMGALVASISFYVGFRRKVSVMESMIRGRIKTKAIEEYMKDIRDRKHKIKKWEERLGRELDIAKTPKEALRKIGFTED